MDVEDQRDVELPTLLAIYPEIQRLHDDDPYTFTLDLPVNPSKAVTVFFPAAAAGQAVSTTASHPAAAPANGHTDSHEIAHLPAVHLQISLPPSYPTEEPPTVSVSTSPPWLPATTAKSLEDECVRLWEDLGRDLVVFSYIDHVQQSADDVFGLVSDAGALEIRPEHKIAVLDYDIEAKRKVFDKETFFCGVCLDPKKGAKCHRMLDCGHVFCVQCLQDFYNNAIKEGDLVSIRCLEPGCAKERATPHASSAKKHRKAKTHLSPSELLQLGLDQEMVKRYVTLKYKNSLESDKNVIYCPRERCQGPARSKNRKKPEGLELHEADEDSDADNEQGSTEQAAALEDRLAVCEDCGFAFCSRCKKGWHGAYVYCRENRDGDELTEEDNASLEFIRLHTSPCPTCACPAQKTQGCNHMICYRCNSHFCYLCSAWLDPANPYQHFNHLPDGRRTSCYMRLWELEEGDENGENHFAGGRGEALLQPRHLQEAQGHRLPEVIQDEAGNARPAARERVALDREVAVTQEGPLVLRLGAVAPREDNRHPAPAPRQEPARGQRANRGQPGGLRRPQQPQAQPGQPVQQGGRARGLGRRPAHHHGPVHGDQVAIDQRMQEILAQRDQVEDGDAAWIRHFVALALQDNEDLLLEDDDE